MSSTALLSYASGPSEIPLSGDTIGRRLERTAEEFADREALVDVPSGRRWTYGEFNADVDRLARGLLDLGIAAGDRVAVWGVNIPEWVLVQYATAKIGAILVTISPAYRVHELTYVLRQSGTTTLLSMPAFKSSDYAAMIAEARPQCPQLSRVIFFGSPGWERLNDNGVAPERLLARMSELDRDDPINIQYTSGTTGFPKGATLSHHNILNNGFFVTEVQRFTECDRLCVQVPFYHCFGMVMGNLGCMAHGACVVIPSPGFDPGATLHAIETERCTALYGVPTMYIAILSHPDFRQTDFTSLRTGIMSGAPCPVELMKKVVAEMHMPEITISYGMTETSPVSTHTRVHDELSRRVNSVGTVHPHVEIKIIDPQNGRTVPRGTPGELCTRGYSVMVGYWNEPEKTSEVVDRAHWMHTGDLATMDEQGYIKIVGRLKEMVIRGGENLYPREIEEFLHTHPDIAEAYVVGVPDEKYGEELCAWVRMREGSEPLTTERLREFCQGKLAHYKIPRYLHVTDAFPMTANGKIRKVEIRERSVELLGLGDVADRERSVASGARAG